MPRSELAPDRPSSEGQLALGGLRSAEPGLGQARRTRPLREGAPSRQPPGRGPGRGVGERPHPVKRDGVELTGSFTASINADLKVGTVQETITVSGETPIVDTQSVRRQTTITNEVISSMPAARSYAGVMMLIPATTTQAGANLDIQVTPGMLVFGGAGGRVN